MIYLSISKNKMIFKEIKLCLITCLTLMSYEDPSPFMITLCHTTRNVTLGYLLTRNIPYKFYLGGNVYNFCSYPWILVIILNKSNFSSLGPNWFQINRKNQHFSYNFKGIIKVSRNGVSVLKAYKHSIKWLEMWLDVRFNHP